MKLKGYLKWMLGAATLLSGCAEDDFIDRSRIWDGTIPDELTLTLTIPDPEIVALGGTRGENGPISTVTLMQYDASGHHLGNISFDQLDIKPVLNSSNPEWTLTATLNKESKSIQVVANYDVADTDTDPSKLETDKDYLLSYTDSKSGPVLWADVELKDLLADNTYAPEIALQRQAAKLSVEVKEDADFELTGFMVYGMAEKGCVAPTAANLAAGNPTIPAGVTGSYNTDWIDPAKFGYFFETAAEAADKNPKARIILKGKYEGKEYYYVAAFRTRTPKIKDEPTETPGAYTYEGIPALRNHWYKLSVEKVRAAGWNSEEEAYTAMPDNRATIELTDMTESISDMIATRDYMLGVSGDVTAEWNGFAEITVVTSYASTIDATAQQGLPVKFSTGTNWIRLSKDQENGIVIGNNTKDIEIELDENSLSTDDRTGEITVTLGKLTRTIKVTQKGRQLRRERTAEIYGLTGLEDGTYYYKWIDDELSESAPKGLSDSENRGENRNNALIFAAVPAYNIYYKIPKETGDKSAEITSGSGSFKKTVDGDYYKLEAVVTDKPNIAKGEFTIKNSEGAEIKYDLLQVGYFHKLDGSHQATAAGVKSGWFYYEVVYFDSGYDDGMYVLDRNLGASTNASYDPTSISYTAEDDAAIGGYFKVNTGRPAEADRKGLYDHKTITDQIGMTYTKGRFIVMSENELKGMGLPSNKNFGSGAISLPFDEGEVAGGNVYLPAAGYYYGTTYRNASHVNLWTRTLLGGTQGLTESDDEYGVNYRILDIFGGLVNYSGLRMGSGSGSTVKENLMRYLPLRLIWRGTDDSMDASDVADSDGSIGTGENITIWVKNSAGWSNMKIYAWPAQIDKDQLSTWSGVEMTKVSHNGESNWYMYSIADGYENLIFTNGSAQTHNIMQYKNNAPNATSYEFEVLNTTSIIDNATHNNYQFLGTGGSGGDTPTERTAITIMLRNDAGWDIGDAYSGIGIRFYDSNGSKVGSDLQFGEKSKVTYENKNWIKVELNNSTSQAYITALNSGGTIEFFNGIYKSARFSEISDTSYGAFFYYNSSTNSGNCTYDHKQASAIVNTTPGWSSGGDTPTEYMTIYFREWGGNVPQNVANGMYLQIDDNATRKFMTKETINNVAYWKCTEVPVNTTKIRFCSNATGNDHSTQEYSGVQSDYKSYGSPLFYAMRGEQGQDWGVFRIDNPSGSGSGSTTITAPDGQVVIYCYNDSNWPRIDMQYRNNDSNNGWPGEQMTLVPGSSNLYYAFAPKGATQIGFSNNTSDFKYQQFSGGIQSDTYFSNLDGQSLSGSRNAPRRGIRRR